MDLMVESMIHGAYLDGDVEDHITLLQDLTLTGMMEELRVESGSECCF